MDAVSQALAKAAGLADHVDARERENELARSTDPRTTATVADHLNRMFSIHRKAFGLAYPKEKLQSRWDPLQVFVVGGGGRFLPAQRRFQKPPWQNLGDRQLASPGLPTDLLIPHSCKADPLLLLVAYGLSFPKLEVPVADSPDDVDPLDISKPFEPPWSREEAYTTDS